jgi:DNA-binding XRE family transcriptional regulator
MSLLEPSCPAPSLTDGAGSLLLERPFGDQERRRGVSTAEIIPTPAECKAIRRRLGWSTQMLAAKAGLKRRTVLDFEAEVRTPQPGTLIAIRRAFRSAGVATGAAG